jgi:hypothetical protein
MRPDAPATVNHTHFKQIEPGESIPRKIRNRVEKSDPFLAGQFPHSQEAVF